MTGTGELAEPYCYLTTTGRVTGRPHTIEIWFAARGRTLYLLSGGGRRSDWVRNLLREPRVRVRVAGRDHDGTARLVTDPVEEAMARRLLPEKYAKGYGGHLSRWSRTALPVAIDPEAQPGR